MSIIKIKNDQSLLLKNMTQSNVDKFSGAVCGAHFDDNNNAKINEDVTITPEQYELIREKQGDFYFIEKGEYIISDLDCSSKSDRTFDISFNDFALDFDLLDLLNLAYITKASQNEKIAFFIVYLLSFKNVSDTEYDEIKQWLETNPVIRVLIISKTLSSKIKDIF